MKILHLIESGGLYGAERVLLDLAVAQQRAGDAPSIISVGPRSCIEKPVERVARERRIDVQPWRMAAGFNWSGMRSILRWAKDREFQIVHSHGYRFDSLLAFADPFKKVPRISTVHGATQTRGGAFRWSQRLGLICQRRMGATVFVSQGSRQSLGRYAQQGVVIPNGVELQPIRQVRENPSSGERGTALELLAIGRMAHEKNYSLLLETVNVLQKRGVACRLTHLGDGVLRDELKEMVEDLSLQNVEFAGYSNDVLGHLHASDVLVFTSRTEGMPIAVIEAMIMGIPVVSTAVGGIPEMLREYPLGRTTAEHEAAAIADEVVDVCEPGRRLRADPATLKAVEGRFSSDRMAADYREVYLQVL